MTGKYRPFEIPIVFPSIVLSVSVTVPKLAMPVPLFPETVLSMRVIDP